MQHGPRGPPRGPMQFKREFPPMEDPAREKAVRSIFGTLVVYNVFGSNFGRG